MVQNTQLKMGKAYYAIEPLKAINRTHNMAVKSKRYATTKKATDKLTKKGTKSQKRENQACR
jgi:hypothetical protein